MLYVRFCAVEVCGIDILTGTDHDRTAGLCFRPLGNHSETSVFVNYFYPSRHARMRRLGGEGVRSRLGLFGPLNSMVWQYLSVWGVELILKLTLCSPTWGNTIFTLYSEPMCLTWYLVYEHTRIAFVASSVFFRQFTRIHGFARHRQESDPFIATNFGGSKVPAHLLFSFHRCLLFSKLCTVIVLNLKLWQLVVCLQWLGFCSPPSLHIIGVT